MSHNSFDVVQLDGLVELRSHNFPMITARGHTLEDALARLNKAIQYFMDNYPHEFMRVMTERKQLGLLCMCGYTAKDKDGPILG